MQAAPFAADETGRLLALQNLALLDTAPERRFDRITQLAARLTGSAVGLVSLVDETRVFFKSLASTASGLDLGRPHREYWFCSHVVATGAAVVVSDARQDPRFDRLGIVTGTPPVLAYAGVPLRAPHGEHVGALAVLSLEAREYSQPEVNALSELARLVEAELSSLPHSAIDALTGALNSMTFTRLGNRLLELADSRGEPVSLLHLDLRGTADINARYGFESGDEALRETAQLLGSAVRGSDLVGRVGADEFAVLLFGSDGAEAKNVVAHLHDATREHNEGAPPHHPYELSFTLGVGEHRPDSGADVTAELVTVAMLADGQP